MERVQKIIANSGLMSRRKAEQYIRLGKVTVNSKTITLGDKADKNKDIIIADGTKLKFDKRMYILLNKPKNYLSTVSDPSNKRTIMELIKTKERLYPIGRLDYDTEGAILLTNDGDFSNLVMHPRYEVKKTYVATVDTELKDLHRLNKIKIEGRAVSIKYKVRDKKTIELTLHEGRKRIVKRILFKLGYYVKSLRRVSIGHVKLGALPVGRYRSLSKNEIDGFLKKNL